MGRVLSEKPKLLLVCDSPEDADHLLAEAGRSRENVVVQSPLRALALLGREAFSGVFASAKYLEEVIQVGRLIQNEQILEGMPDGVAVLDADNTILWSNSRMAQWCGREAISGENFFAVLDSPEILGPDFCPFHTALATGRGTGSTLKSRDNKYYHVHAAPVREDGAPARRLIVTVRDVTWEADQSQKLAAIHQAGTELADLTPDEVRLMSVKERVELIKSNIVHFTQDLLHYETVEIRLLDQKTRRLDVLLGLNMEPEATARELYAEPKDNGVTGFVAATGKSYLCEDTAEDPLYLQGARGAKSSLTVPLLLHDAVIGTFNVESGEPKAFDESDLQFLEIFARDVASSLNTLDLLAAEKISAAVESCEAIHSAVALPVDVILNEAVNVMERYIGHDPDVVARLQRILRNARDIKQVIQRVGQKMAPTEALPQGVAAEPQGPLAGRHILVIDADEDVRSASHNLLERFGCVVETARDGEDAIRMVRSMTDNRYDLVISEIKLPDMNAHVLMTRLRDIVDPVPLALMTGFGWDPAHVVVKCREAGLPPNAVLYKPFRIDQMLSIVKTTIEIYETAAKAVTTPAGSAAPT